MSNWNWENIQQKATDVLKHVDIEDPKVLYGIIAVITTLFIFLLSKCCSKNKDCEQGFTIVNQKKYAKYDKNTIILHIFPRWKSHWPHIWKDALYQCNQKHSNPLPIGRSTPNKNDSNSDDDCKDNNHNTNTNNNNNNINGKIRRSSVDSGWSVRFTNASPFCVKLESLLTYYGFKYMIDESSKLSSKSKSPSITYYDKILNKWIHIGDSQIIIERLLLQENNGSHFNQDYQNIDEILFAHSLKSYFEDTIYFYMLYHRWIDNRNIYIPQIVSPMGVPSIFIPIIKMLGQKQVKKQIYYQGVGRHTRNEIYNMFKEKIDMIIKYLNNHIDNNNTSSSSSSNCSNDSGNANGMRMNKLSKKFIFGNEMTSIDCIAFSFLSCIFDECKSNYKGFNDIYNDNDNPLIKYKHCVEQYCIRVRIELEKRRIDVEDLD